MGEDQSGHGCRAARALADCTTIPVADSFDFDSGGRVPLLDVLRRFPETLRVRWMPGTRLLYTNTDYVIVGYIIEKLTGQSCDQFVADNILRPLGMMHSNMRLSPAIKSALAQGYEGNPPRAVPYLPPAK